MFSYSNNLRMFTKTGFCLVTGASKGLGKSIATKFALQWHKNGAKLDMMILARDEEGLKSCKEAIADAAPSVNVISVPYDLSDLSRLQEVVSKVPDNQYESLLLVHDAGTCPDISRPLLTHDDGARMQYHFAINYSSMVTLNSLLLTKLKDVQSKTVVLITSILATNPMNGFGLYGACKAARDSYARVLALENPTIRVLSYSPGPLDTEMLQHVRSSHYSDDVKKSIKGSFEKGEVLKPDVTVKKLVDILESNNFESGKVVDYYDGILKAVTGD